ncbi:unnamed protein product [Linum tenue]|uniref:O-fucosyltransferase family protein n=1 Tax=Linum tenue TaxID=586396 RepID=A0AAV0HYA0_9ROSI|nr:unnamed protein product [Linum tenue]
MILIGVIAFGGLISIFSIFHRLNAPYLCKKDGIALHCPHFMTSFFRSRSLLPSGKIHLSAITFWKPCAERRDGGISDVPRENETNDYIFIHAEGGLNRQRIAICNAVAVAKIMNATPILPVLKQDQIWKDQTKFENIFDVDHFIDYLKDDVRIVRDIPEWFTEKNELFTSIRRTMKNIPNYAPTQFYIDNVLPRIKEKKIMSLKPFVDRLGYDNVPQEINKLRALHLRFEKGMVGLSFCHFVRTRDEKVKMAEYRRKNGLGILRMVPIYGNWLFRRERKEGALLNQVTKEELATSNELTSFRKHVTSLASLDFLVCLKSNVFVMTHKGNFAKLIIGAHRYMGHH